MEAGEINAATPFVRALFDDWEHLDFRARYSAIEQDSNLLGFVMDTEALKRHEQELRSMLPDAPTEEDRVRILAAIAGVCANCGEHALACSLGDELVELARRHVDRFRLGLLLAGHAFNLTVIRALSRAEAAILEAIDIARESNHVTGLAHRLWIYGGLMIYRDRIRAREVWNESLAYHREVNNRQGILWVLGNLAIADIEDQQFSRADPLLRERLRLAKALNDQGAVHQTFCLLARLSIAIRDWDNLNLLTSERHHFGVPPALAALELGWVAEQRGHRDEAFRLYQSGLQKADDLPDLQILLRLCLREPLQDDQNLRDALDRLDARLARLASPSGSEILDHVIRSVRLRHTLTAL